MTEPAIANPERHAHLLAELRAARELNALLIERADEYRDAQFGVGRFVPEPGTPTPELEPDGDAS